MIRIPVSLAFVIFLAAFPYAAKYDAWKSSMQIVLNTTASGANISAAIPGLLVLIRLNKNNFDFTAAKNNGADLRITDAADNDLPFVIERWDIDREKGEIIVKVPKIKANNNSQHVILYWGNPDASSKEVEASSLEMNCDMIGVWNIADIGKLDEDTKKRSFVIVDKIAKYNTFNFKDRWLK